MISSSWGHIEVRTWAGRILRWEHLGLDPGLWACFWVFHRDSSSYPPWGQAAVRSADAFHLSSIVCPPMTGGVWLPMGMLHFSASFPRFSWAPSPCQRFKLSTLRWLQLKLTLISENIDTNLNMTLNMGCTSPSTGVFVRGGGGQHLTLAARGKGNTLNIFALKHTPLAFLKSMYPN